MSPNTILLFLSCISKITLHNQTTILYLLEEDMANKYEIIVWMLVLWYKKIFFFENLCYEDECVMVLKIFILW